MRKKLEDFEAAGEKEEMEKEFPAAPRFSYLMLKTWEIPEQSEGFFRCW